MILELVSGHPLNALAPIVVTPDGGNMRVVKAAHPLHKDSGIVASPVVLNVTDISFVQPLNALLPILVTKLGIEMEVRFVQPMNALLPILVTKLSIETEVIVVQFSNALLPILVTE